jgi:hypothetical protein
MHLPFTSGLVLQAIARGYRYGFEIVDLTGLPTGTVYPARRSLTAVAVLTVGVPAALALTRVL